MSTEEHTRLVPVDALCKGLYIAELDRPWTETPFLFQGFELSDDDELAILRSHCHHVYIYPQRSHADALNELDASLAAGANVAPTKSRNCDPQRWVHAHAATHDTFGAARRPDSRQFRERVQYAQELRSEARGVITEALDDMRLGQMLSSPKVRSVVDSLVDTIARDARAALWLTSLKQNSQYTSVHSVHVAILSLAFGMHLGMDRAALIRLGMGALLHDVGKVRIPEEILDKPGPLTAAEMKIVQRHAEDGYEFVAKSGGAPPEALQIIRLHHERCDGSGYPLGLTGDRIPLHVRIVAIADTYDAMTTDRPYRAAMDADKALQLIQNESAHEFGSDLVQAFIRCMGVFPEGSLVQLDNGCIGIVVSSPPDARLQPVVLLVQAPDGEPYDKRLLFNLATAAGADEDVPPRRIARAVTPAACNVDVSDIMAREFGLMATG